MGITFSVRSCVRAATVAAALSIFMTGCSAAAPAPSTSPTPTATTSAPDTPGHPVQVNPIPNVRSDTNEPKGFTEELDDWYCAYWNNAVQFVNVDLEDFFNQTISIEPVGHTITTKQSSDEVSVLIAPHNNQFFGGIVRLGKQDNYAYELFRLPRSKDGEGAYAPYFVLPHEKFGTIKELQLCTDPDREP